MLPRWHIIYGFIFSLVFWFLLPGIEWYNIVILFLASILIDFDHYMCSVYKTGKISLSESFKYHAKREIEQINEQKKGIRRRGDFHVFHTIEFHLAVFCIGLFFEPFLYIFLGMVFHSLLDLYSLTKRDFVYRREYLLFNYLRR